MPRDLYKYVKWDDRTRLVLLRNALYLPTSSQFNDPFDCRLPLSFNHNVREYADEINAWANRVNQRYGKRVVEPMSRGFLQHNAPLGLKMQYESYMEEINHRTRVLCFTAVRDDILMWSHYSAGHTGICLRFKIANDGPFADVKRVRYSRTSPRIDLLHDPEGHIVMTSMLSKSRHWSYEKEWRLVLPHCKQDHIHFPPDQLIGVILGCEMDRDAKSQVLCFLAERSAPVSVYEAVKKEFEFGLRIEPMMKMG